MNTCCWKYVCEHACAGVCKWVFVCVCLYVLCVFVCECLNLCLCVCLYLCVCLCVIFWVCQREKCVGYNYQCREERFLHFVSCTTVIYLPFFILFLKFDMPLILIGYYDNFIHLKIDMKIYSRISSFLLGYQDFYQRGIMNLSSFCIHIDHEFKKTTLEIINGTARFIFC